MLGKELSERRDGDVEQVAAKVPLDRGNLVRRLNPGAALESRERRRRVAGIRDSSKLASGSVKEVLVSLVREGDEVRGTGALEERQQSLARSHDGRRCARA